MFRASLCPSSGEQRTRYCIWCVVVVLLDVVGSGCGALRCMRIACLIPRAIDKSSDHVIFIAFLGEHKLRERSSLLRLYVHILYFIFLALHVYPTTF
jgi:hypothetical protein